MRPSQRNIDLYTVLPRAKSEPIYVKSDWQREELAETKEARPFRGLKAAKFGSIEAGTIVRSKTDLQPRDTDPTALPTGRLAETQRRSRH